MAKLESGNAEWHPTELDMRKVISESVATTEPADQGQAGRPALELDDGLPPVMADHDRLIQVMLNLLSNAVKFCPPG